MATKKTTAKKPTARKPTTKKPASAGKARSASQRSTQRRTAQPGAPQPAQQTIVVKQKNSVLKKIVLWVVIIVLILTGLSYGLVALANGVDSVRLALQNVFGTETEVPDTKLDGYLPNQSNGGFTPKEIEDFKADDSTPYGEDLIRNFAVKDLGNYVVLFREVVQPDGLVLYPNLLFAKTSNGLKWDGAVGVKANFSTDWWTGKHDWSNPNTKFTLDLNANNAYKKSGANVVNVLSGIAKILSGGLLLTNADIFTGFENVVTFSDFKTDFATNFKNANGIAWAINGNSETAILKQLTWDFLNKNVLIKYFQNITDTATNGSVEMIGVTGATQEEIYTKNLQKLNSFANFLYNQSKTNDGSKKTTAVDISHYFAQIIPAAQQPNYPIPTAKKSNYPGLTNYGIWQNEIVANVTYSFEKTTIKRDQSKVESNTAPYMVAPQPAPEDIKQLSIVSVSLKNIGSTDLTGYDITSAPVTIHFGNKPVTFNKVGLLNQIKTVILETNENYNYNIDSDVLIFEAITGSYKPTTSNASLSFNYSYTGSTIAFNIRLNNLTTIDLSTVDLALQPVKIMLTNSAQTKTYTYIFDTVGKVTYGLTQNIERGTYNYTILSDRLEFSNNVGVVEISNTNRGLVLNYGISAPAPITKTFGLSDAPMTRGNQDLNMPKTIKLQLFIGNFYNNFEIGHIKNLKITIYNSDLTFVMFEESILKTDYYDSLSYILIKDANEGSLTTNTDYKVFITFDYLNIHYNFIEFNINFLPIVSEQFTSVVIYNPMIIELN